MTNDDEIGLNIQKLREQTPDQIQMKMKMMMMMTMFLLQIAIMSNNLFLALSLKRINECKYFDNK